jgi:hypothetical protein
MSPQIRSHSQLELDQPGMVFPVGEPSSPANRFVAASIALPELRADHLTIERWQQRKGLPFLGISLMKHTRLLDMSRPPIR